MRWGVAFVFLAACSDPPAKAPVAPPPPPVVPTPPPPPAPVASEAPAPKPDLSSALPSYTPIPDGVELAKPEKPLPYRQHDPPPQNDPGATKAEIAACSARGGTMQPTCLSYELRCVVRFRDAGKKCSDKKDCFGRCIWVGADPAPPSHAIGQCEPTNDPCGCAAVIKNGRAGEAMCVD